MPVVDVDRLKEQGRRFVDGFTPGQKAMTILGVIAVVFAGMTFMKWAATPDYTPLYSGLSSQDAGAVTQQLDSQGIKYKISAGGSTILVSKQDVYKTRISLSAKGIPAGGGDSFVKFDNQSITTDQFTRNIDYQRALQSELAKTIEAIDTVQGATVTLTIPQQTVFVGANQDKATAAVLVKPQAGATLPTDSVSAIVNLVASSVPNMNPDDVTVADTNGKVLHAPGMDLSSSGSTAVEQQQAVEQSISKKVSDLIAASLGPGHAAVTVSADLDPSKHVTVSNTFKKPAGAGADGLATGVDDKTTSLTEPGASGTSGQLGLNGNGTATGSGGNRTYKETDTKHQLAVDQTQDTVTIPSGAIRKLSVAVLLDSGAVKNQADIASIWQPEIAKAAGIQTPRDGATVADALTVQTTAFDQTALNAAKAVPAAGGNAMFDLIKHFLTLLMIGLILFFAWRAIKKAEANRVPLRVPLDLRELEAPALAPLEAAAVPARVAAPARPSLEPPVSTIEGDITELIERQPEEVAQTLRSWLADRRT